MRHIKQILNEIGNGVMYNLHSHTQFCDGRADMEKFAEAASRLGFSHYGFTPHSPIPIYSSCNMAKDDVAKYLAEVERLRLLYPDMKLLAGMEIDYLGPQWGPANPYFSQLPLDFTIGSIHFIPTPDGEMIDVDGRPESFKDKLDTKFDGNLDYVVDKFFEHTHMMIDDGGFDIIGHYDKIKRNADFVRPGITNTEHYKKLADELTDHVIDAGVVVEINTKSFKDTGHFFPQQRHWKRLLDAGVDIVVNSDAHYPDRINEARPDVFKALRYLKNRK